MDELNNLKTISVMIADDHCLVREALASALKSHPRFFVTTADSYATAQTEILKVGKVDVLLLDIVMPGMNGLKSIEEFVKFNSGGAVVVFSGNTASDFTKKALALGARGFIPKTLPLRSLATAIQLIASGEIFVPIDASNPFGEIDHNELDSLTSRELLVLGYVSEGLTNKEIARKIDVVEMTVKMHMRSICIKLKAKNRAHAAIVGAQVGLLKSDRFLT
jgi:two-component system nitrate/nitrite response regulator NarL